MAASRLSRRRREASTPVDRIGHYHIEERLGRGGMGEIYRAFDTKKRRHVAIKTILSRMADDDQMYRRFAREMKLAARLHHPAIVEVFEVLHVAGGACVVMELVDGFTLRAALRSGPLSLQDTLHIAHRVCEGLVEAHQHYIVHRDIKAENIMISHQNQVKILDFGLARAVGGDFKDQTRTLTRTGMIVGSAGSMAPEQILGEPVDPRTDLFSLGCLIYRMLTGQSPFHSRSFVHTLAAITSTPHRPLVRAVPSIPVEVSQLVDRLLEKLPEHRPQGSEEARETLAELVEAHGPCELDAAALMERQGAGGSDTESSVVSSTASSSLDDEPSLDVSMVLGASPPPDFFSQPEFESLNFADQEGQGIEDAFQACQERLQGEMEHLDRRVEALARWRMLSWTGSVLAMMVAVVGWSGGQLGVAGLAVLVALGLGGLAWRGFDGHQTRLRQWEAVRHQRSTYASQWLETLQDVGDIDDQWARSRRHRQLARAFSQRVENPES